MRNQEKRYEDFDGQNLNVLRLNTVKEVEIAIAEIKYAIDNINRDLELRAGDELWAEMAIRAKDSLAHKGQMLVLRLSDLREQEKRRNEKRQYMEKIQSNKLPPFAANAISFQAAAKAMMDEKAYLKIVDVAARMKQAMCVSDNNEERKLNHE